MSAGVSARSSAEGHRETTIAIELVRPRLVSKPWGRANLRPWNTNPQAGPIGEIWFERRRPDTAPALLLKLLFAEQPLSIQVHPDDDHARAIGLPHGKSEAWYVLSAKPGAGVAIGLEQPMTGPQLRAAIENGTIEALVHWRPVEADDVVMIPAGTIHAIGAGVVVAEIQQTSDTTFRLFDFGRGRALHGPQAVAVAEAGPAGVQSPARRLSPARLLLAADPHFVLERLDLPPNSLWTLRAEAETWLLALGGQAQVGPFDLGRGEALFLEADQTVVEAGPAGLEGLVAYARGAPSSDLLRPAHASPPAALASHPVPETHS